MTSKSQIRARAYREENPILLVEDNPDDVLITKRAWKKGNIKNKLLVVNNGEEALRFLRKEKDYEDASTPCLILLDLNMPKINGFEVIEIIKSDDLLKWIPIIVLTSSDRTQDIEKAYNLGCNSYIVKPMNFENFIQAILVIEQYWLTISKIPTHVHS
jgi:CheY-like chemotaxis protein